MHTESDSTRRSRNTTRPSGHMTLKQHRNLVEITSLRFSKLNFVKPTLSVRRGHYRYTFGESHRWTTRVTKELNIVIDTSDLGVVLGSLQMLITDCGN